MDLLMSAWQFVSHLDRELAMLLAQYGPWVYALLFAIVFCETGLVVTPFLPGDSLLFAAGALWASARLSPGALCVTLVAAALGGDNCNYWIGRLVGRKILARKSRLVDHRAVERTERFYARHGGKTLVMARFVPLVRTFAPFVAGIGAMSYARFIAYSIAGAVFWVVLLVLAGYWFGDIPLVRDNFGLVVIAIVAVSLLPFVVELSRAALRRRSLES